MKHIIEIEERIETYIKDLNLTSPKGLFIVLNKNVLRDSTLNVNSICLHLADKYKGMQWPKLCVDNNDTLLLFIGRSE